MCDDEKEARSPAAYIQLSAKGPEDEILYGDTDECHPQFSIKHKRHSHMATYEKVYPFINKLSFNKTTQGNVVIPENGDAFITNMYLHLNVQQFLKSGTNINGATVPYYVKNLLGLRCIKRLKIFTSRVTLCDLDADGLYIILQSFYGNKPGFAAMIGDYDITDPQLVSHVLTPHMYIPLPLWFAETHKEKFPLCLMEKDSIQVSIEFDKVTNNVELHPSEDFRIKI